MKKYKKQSNTAGDENKEAASENGGDAQYNQDPGNLNLLDKKESKEDEQPKMDQQQESQPAPAAEVPNQLPSNVDELQQQQAHIQRVNADSSGQAQNISLNLTKIHKDLEKQQSFHQTSQQQAQNNIMQHNQQMQ